MSAPEQCILGLDPGLSGAIAFYSPVHPELIVAEDIPVAGGEVDAATLARRIAQMAPTIAVIERVGAMPKQGVASTFKFGVAFGMARAVVSALGIPTHLVAPSRWKKHFRLNADKEMARARALQLWPASQHFSRKKDHNRAEAALLARYGAETLSSPTVDRRKAPE
jgi:crossover junction endodeoxyribonuclease RuvC